jgi:pimeloyl-ACP methyl ester carboxylesterase
MGTRALEAAATRLTTPCGAGRMAWRLWGEGPPLVLLHGDFGSWTHWLRCIPALARRCRVVAPDMPGYGESAAPPEPWSPETLAAIIAEGLAAVLPPPARLALAGFSFGGIVATHLAARPDGRVDRLALLGPGGFALPLGPMPMLRRLGPGMAAAEMRAVHRHNLAALMFADPEKVDEGAVDLQLANTRRARIRGGDIPQSDALLRALPRVRARIVGIWGERDVFSRPVAAREAALRRHRPDLDFRVLPGVGHWSPYEAPEAVTAALLDFVMPRG